MTYIELFGKNPIENICTCLVNTPDRVIMIGDNSKTLGIHKKRYENFFLKRGENIEFITKTVNKNSLIKIVDLLCDIIETYDDCVIDLTGGEELMLVAVGIVFHRYRDMDIQLHRFNLRTNSIYDCDNDGKLIDIKRLPQLTVEETINLFGGVASYENEGNRTNQTWNFTDEFKDDIDNMWEVCKYSAREWNAQIAVFKAAESVKNSSSDALKTVADINEITSLLMNKGSNYIYNKRIIKSLTYYGLIEFDKSDDKLFSIKYKNEQVKKCLTKEGQVLEMEVTVAAMEVKDHNLEPIYTDVKNGVHIDWDGNIHHEENGYDTENEIDVLMTHQLVPVFVSCKNGRVDIDELYKLDTVATKFGGKYARKVLVATALNPSTPYTHYLMQRAKDMGIRIVNNMQTMTYEEMQKCVRSFWSNP